MKHTSYWLLFGSLGAAALYLLDPKDGRRRRSLVAKNAKRVFGTIREEGGRSLQDTRHQLSGIAARFGSALKHETPSDCVLEQRIRSRIGHLISHVRRVHIICDNGSVTLWGQILRDEWNRLIQAVGSVAGVKELYDHLELVEPHDFPVQNLDQLREARKEIRLKWSRARRLWIGAAGAALAVYGFRREGVAAKAISLLGAGLVARSLMKNHLRSTMALSESSPGFELEKTIRINAPISEIFDFWINPENYSHAFSHVHEVERVGENLFRWTVNGPGGITFQWEGTLTRIVPNTLVEWKSLPGSSVANFGRVHFDPIYDGSTRVNIRMFYRPPAGIVGRFVAELLGANPANILDEDLRRLKYLFENGRCWPQAWTDEEEAEFLKTATT